MGGDAEVGHSSGVAQEAERIGEGHRRTGRELSSRTLAVLQAVSAVSTQRGAMRLPAQKCWPQYSAAM